MDAADLLLFFLLVTGWLLLRISQRKKERQKALERQAALLKQSETKDSPG